MTDINDGGPAFPCEYSTQASTGMSLRDWFAGQALSSANWGMTCADNRDFWAGVAQRAYLAADAMLEARKASECSDG